MRRGRLAARLCELPELFNLYNTKRYDQTEGERGNVECRGRILSLVLLVTGWRGRCISCRWGKIEWKGLGVHPPPFPDWLNLPSRKDLRQYVISQSICTLWSVVMTKTFACAEAFVLKDAHSPETDEYHADICYNSEVSLSKWVKENKQILCCLWNRCSPHTFPVP